MVPITEAEFKKVFHNRLIRRRNAIANGIVYDYTNCGMYFILEGVHYSAVLQNMTKVHEYLKDKGYIWDEANPPRPIKDLKEDKIVKTYIYFFKKPKLIKLNHLM